MRPVLDALASGKTMHPASAALFQRGETTGTAVEQILTVAEDTAVARGPASAYSVFQQDWWLRAAAGDALEVAEVRWGDRLVASLPFIRRKRLGFTMLDMPPYTRTVAPVLQLPASKPAQHQRNMHAAIAGLLAAMPAYDRLQFMLGPGEPTAFSLALAGCSLGQHFTFRIGPEWDVEHHWSVLDQKTRNLIRTSQRDYEIVREAHLDTLLSMAVAHHRERNRTDEQTLRRIADEAVQRGQLLTLCAVNASGRAVAAATLVWDHTTLYFWQSARDKSSARGGANSLLIWHAMLEARQRGLVFDIDGYHSSAGARFVSRFGLHPASRTGVIHLSARGRSVQALGRLFGRGSGFGVSPIGATFAET